MGEMSGKGGKIYLGGEEVVGKADWTLNTNRDYPDPREWVDGLKDVQGTFTGLMDLAGDSGWLFDSNSARMIYFWAPKSGNRLQHWFWLLRERLLRIPYPSELVWSGEADVESHTEAVDEDGVEVHSVTFRSPPRG